MATTSRVIRVTTSLFDVSKERPNPINPIAGESLLLWLQARSRPQLELSPPAAEDWGWYSDVTVDGRRYTIGASTDVEEDDGSERAVVPSGAAREWVLQIVKHRSMSEKLLGREALAADDRCVAIIQRLLSSEPAFGAISVDPES